MKEKKRSSKLGWLAVFLWVVGFGLAFVIAPGSPYILVPDGLLLVGFWPLLIANRCRWLWLVFGVFNTFIGFVLLVVRFMPDKEFSFDPKVLATKTHLGQYHEPFTWMIVGVISAVIGLVLIVIGLVRWLVRKTRKSKVQA